MQNPTLYFFLLHPSSARSPSKFAPFYCTAAAPLDLEVPLSDMDLDLSFLFLSLFADLPFRSTLRAFPDVSADLDNFTHAFSLRITLTASSKFKIHVPQELLTAISRPLNSLRCSAMLLLSTIFRLNNFFIKNTLFDAEGFSYVFDSVAIKSLVVFYLETLRATTNARDNRIAPRAFRSRISH